VHEGAGTDSSTWADLNSVGLVLLNLQNHLVANSNDFFLDLVRHPRSDLPLPWEAITPPEWQELEQSRLAQVLDTGLATAWEQELLAPHDHRIPVSVAFILMSEDPKLTVGMVVNLSQRKRKPVAEQELTGRTKFEQEVSDYWKRLRDLTVRLALAEERERRRIAEGLHDIIGQRLAIATLEINLLQAKEDSPEKLRNLRKIKRLIKQTSQVCRSLSFELSSPVLYQLGLEAAIKSLGNRLLAETGITFRFRSDRRPTPLSDQMKVLLFRSLRELIRNIVSHARARNVSIEVHRVGDQVYIRVEDDGVGFNAAKLNDLVLAGHYGLASIREQLFHAGGSMRVESQPGKGSRVLLQTPLEQPDLGDSNG